MSFALGDWVRFKGPGSYLGRIIALSETFDGEYTIRWMLKDGRPWRFDGHNSASHLYLATPTEEELYQCSLAELSR